MSTTIATGNNTGLPDGTKIADDLIGTGTPPSSGDRVQYVKLDVGAAGLSSPVSGAVPVSATALPLPSGAGTSALQSTGNTSLASIDTKTPALGQALAAASVPVILPAATITTLTPPAAITGFALEAGHLATIDTKTPALVTGRVPVDASGVAVPVTGTFFQATQPVSGTVTAAQATAASLLATVTQGPANATPWNENVAQVGGVAVVAGAKGTQQTNAIPTQDMKDAGRTPIVLTLDSLSGITTEALATMSINSGGAVTNATSYTVTAGKKLRISSIVHDCIVPSTTGCASRLRLRGAAASFSVTSPIYVHSAVGTSATAFAGFSEDMAIPDGLEFPAGFIIGLSHIESSAIAGSTTTGAGVHACIIGYEY